MSNDNDQGPGTPLGRLNAIADFAVSRGLCSGAEAKPAELFVMERLEKVETALREIASHCTELANTEDVSVGDRRCYKSLAAIANAALS